MFCLGCYKDKREVYKKDREIFRSKNVVTEKNVCTLEEAALEEEQIPE